MSNILVRIEHLRQGRAHHTWLGSFGVARNTIKAIKDSEATPSDKVINTIARCENASYRWLVEGEGPPYRVANFKSDRECKEALSQYLKEEAWTVYLLNDYQKQALVMTLPSAFERSHGGFIEYLAIEILTGVGKESVAEAALNASAFKVVTVSSEVMNSLVAGELGTYALLGDAKTKGILSTAELIGMNDRLSKYGHDVAPDGLIAEEPNDSTTRPEVYAMMVQFKKLSTKHKKAVMNLIRDLSD